MKVKTMNDTILEMRMGLSLVTLREIMPVGERVMLDNDPVGGLGLTPRGKSEEQYHPYLESLMEKKTLLSLQARFNDYMNAPCEYGPTGFCNTHNRGPHCPYS